MADEWHCKQIPNGSNPLVVCERESLQAEIERLRQEVDLKGGRLDDALDEIERLRAELQQVANERALAESKEARRD